MEIIIHHHADFELPESLKPDYDRKATHRLKLSNADIENILDCMREAEIRDANLPNQQLFDRLLKALR